MYDSISRPPASVDYESGDVVAYSAFGGAYREVVVEERIPEIKNGRDGFVGTVVEGREAGKEIWGYDYQIVRVVRPASAVRPCDHAVDNPSCTHYS